MPARCAANVVAGVQHPTADCLAWTCLNCADAYAQAARFASVKAKPSPYLTLFFENNPVAAAFGTVETRHRTTGAGGLRCVPLEWDVYVDAAVAAQVVTEWKACSAPRTQPSPALLAAARRLATSTAVSHGTVPQIVKEFSGLDQVSEACARNKPAARCGT